MEITELISRRTLEAEPWPSYARDREGRIAYVNGAWDREAQKANGPRAAHILGTRWLAHIVGAELRAWYDDLLGRVLAQRVGERHLGDCNTPDRHRLFSGRFDPLVPRGSAEAAGVVVVNTMMEDAPIAERYPIAPPDDRAYRQPTGLILQCSGCRRVQVPRTSPRLWVFVPEYVAKPHADTSHGLCEVCREAHYGTRT